MKTNDKAQDMLIISRVQC